MGNSGSRAAKTATEALKVLWDETFFSAWKRLKAIEEQLAKRGNHFSGPELGMALMRAKHLTRRGKQGSYEYIQKYPAAIENAKPKPKRK
jgi:hypothetical protein